MEYTFDIYNNTSERLLKKLAENVRRSRLDRGMSRRSLSEKISVPEATIERFETKGLISLESFVKIAIFFDYFDELGSIMSETKFKTGKELETINSNRNRQKGR